MKKKRFVIIPSAVLIALFTAFAVYTGIYYHADETALAALTSDEIVEVINTDEAILFDGPSETDVLIFLPGAKVEETAYAPLLHQLAADGADVCLIKAPFKLALFALGTLEELVDRYSRSNLYIGGHSLGGAMAASYAAEHGESIDGVVMLAAYATKEIDEHINILNIHGSEDKVLNAEKLNSEKGLIAGKRSEFVIPGGNHAQFGNYGKQKGDGEAFISSIEQQTLTSNYIKEFIWSSNH